MTARFSSLAVVLLVTLVATAASAREMGLRNGIRAQAVSNSVFEIAPRGGSGVQEFWCGAGEYARRALGAKGGETLYVVGGIGQGQVINRKSTAQFSLLPPSQAQGASGRQGRWGPALGDSMTVSQARGRCRPVTPARR